MRTIVNEVTGARELETTSVFNRWATNKNGDIITRENVNGNKYRIAEVDVNLPGGEVRTTPALCYEGNYNHTDANFKAGKEYLTRVSEGIDEDDNSLYVRLSHLTGGTRLTKDDVGDIFGEVESSETVETQEIEDQLA